MCIIGHHGNSFLSFGVAPVGEIGGWIELGRTTLGSTSDTVTVSSLADKRYLMILSNSLNSGAIAGRLRLNTDSGSNYAYRASDNGGADFTATSDT